MTKYHVDVDPDVVFQLGDTLISDEVTALVELVKNSYDADANWVRVVVSTGPDDERDGLFYPSANGRIVVEDDGTGMDLEQIENGWLRVAASRKREAKERGETTPLHRRALLGDKGLGRLGVQRLAEAVEIITRKSVVRGTSQRSARPTDESYHVGVDWRDFEGRKSILDVPVRLEAGNGIRKGTRIILSSLRRPEYWSERIHRNDLQSKLSQFVSPFKAVANFRVYVQIDGDALDLVDVSSGIRRSANARHSFSFSDGLLALESRYRATALQPTDTAAREYEAVVGDDVAALFSHLKATQPLLATATTSDRWLLHVKKTIVLDSLGDVARRTGEPADPGPFEGEIDVFWRSGPTLSAELNAIMKVQRGVRIYRDGFAIRPYGIDGEDWLRLGEAQTAGSSFYGLRPGNVIGYIAITSADNGQLREKTDREGFVDSPEAANFFRLMREVRQSVNSTNEAIRRGYLDYRRSTLVDLDGSEQPPVDLFAELRMAVSRGRDLRGSAEQLRRAVSSVAHAVQKSDAPADVMDEVDGLANRAESVAATLENHASQLERWTPAAAAAEIDERELRRRLQDLTELAALGLAAEAITHEIDAIANTLADRTRRLRQHLRKLRANDVATETYVESLRSSISSLRKQLSHLAPALRYVRERRDRFRLLELVEELADFHQESLQRFNIRLTVERQSNPRLHMNRGRLVQVLDNLILNSRYWLRQDLAARKIDDAAIFITTAGAFIDVSDSGRGVDTNVEDTLFEPFVTRKPPSRGRGLGLFIARQLMEGSGGTLELLPERNAFGNRYIFRVGLSGVIIDDE